MSNVSPDMPFRVVIIGGTGQVGASVVRALAAEPACLEVIMVNRRETPASGTPRVRQVVVDTASTGFPAEVTRLVTDLMAKGAPVYGASCVGVGAGSARWSEEALKALELGVVGGFATGCRAGGVAHFSVLSAVGSNAGSRIRYIRVMGLKEAALEAVGFARLAVFRPGIIGGNVHTPGFVAWLGRLIPGRFGTIEQDDIGGAFAAEFAGNAATSGVSYFDNNAMRVLARRRIKSS
jgi:uncharacterized protein YbjT (DUF2867 family)